MRVSLCQRIGWRLLPHELDDLEPAVIRTPLLEYEIFETFVVAGEDLKKLSPAQVELYDSILRIMDGTIG